MSSTMLTIFSNPFQTFVKTLCSIFAQNKVLQRSPTYTTTGMHQDSKVSSIALNVQKTKNLFYLSNLFIFCLANMESLSFSWNPLADNSDAVCSKEE